MKYPQTCRWCHGKFIDKNYVVRIYCSRGCYSEALRAGWYGFKIPPSARGKKMKEKQKEKISKSNKTAYANPELRKAVSDRLIGKPQYHLRGNKNPMWKGGITPINAAIRQSLEYKNWRRAVFKRDGYTCVFGGVEHGKNLQADHIKPFAYFPELRFELSNGRTLCVPCHKKTDTYLNKNYGKTHHYQIS